LSESNHLDQLRQTLEKNHFPEQEDILALYEQLVLEKKLTKQGDILDRVKQTIELLRSLGSDDTKPLISEVIDNFNSSLVELQTLQMPLTDLPRNEEYYHNLSFVKADLEAFTEELSEKKGKNMAILDLNTGNIEFLEITCSNGEKVKGRTYLVNAAVSLRLADNSTEGKTKKRKALKSLVQIAGFKIKEYAPRDAEYYRNPEFVKTDLETFTEELSKQRDEAITVLDLNPGNIRSLEIVCSNGEKVKGRTYLINAGIALDLAKTTREAGNKTKDILSKLRQIAGFKTKEYAPRDAEYYRNPEFVKTDLEAFAEELSKQKDEVITVSELTPYAISTIEIIACNQERVRGQTYLLNTCITLSLARTTREATSKQKIALDILLKIAGFDSESLIDKEFETLRELELEDAIALLGESDPLKLKIYIQFAHPELSEEKVNKLTIRSIRAISAHKENITREEQILLTHRNTLPKPKITTEVPKKTEDDTIIINGKAEGSNFVYLSGTYNKRTKVQPDGTFSEKIPLFTDRANEVRFMAVNTDKKERSPQSNFIIYQTGMSDEAEGLIKLLSKLGKDKLAEYKEGEQKSAFLLQTIEQALIKKFSTSFEEGIQYTEKLIQNSESNVIKEVLERVTQNFSRIAEKEIPHLREGEDLYFFQKYCYEVIKRKIESGAPGMILANAPGLGKTLVALSIAKSEDNSSIISPNNVVGNWTKDSQRFFENFGLLRLQHLSTSLRKKILKQANHKHVVSNIEYLRQVLSDEEIIDLISNDETTLVQDEAHSLVNLSQQTQGTLKLKKKFFLLLSASPFKDPVSVRRILHTLYPEKKEYSDDQAFAQAFPKNDPQALKMLNRLVQEHMIRFRKRDVMEEFDISKPLAEQKGRLPHKKHISPFEIGQFVMTEEQAEAIYEMFLNWNKWCRKYNKFIPKDTVTKLDGLRKGRDRLGEFPEDTAEQGDKDFILANKILGNESNLSREHALKQIINNPEYVGLQGIQNPKDEVVKQMVKRCLQERRKVVLFCEYNAQAEKYKKMFAELNPALYTGLVNREGFRKNKQGKKTYYKVDKNENYIIDTKTGLPIEDKEAKRMSKHSLPMSALEYEELKFDKNGDCQMLISTFGAGAVGKNFPAGKSMIMDNLPKHYLWQYQTEDRIHRIDEDHLTHYDVTYNQALSLYPQNFLEKMKKRWVREMSTKYQLLDGKKGVPAKLVNFNEKDTPIGRIITLKHYEEVFDEATAKKEGLPSAYAKFFKDGTYDEVRYENLKTQKKVFRLINDGIADESLLEENLVAFNGLE